MALGPCLFLFFPVDSRWWWRAKFVSEIVQSASRGQGLRLLSCRHLGHQGLMAASDRCLLDRTSAATQSTAATFRQSGRTMSHTKSCFANKPGQGIAAHGRPMMKSGLSKSPWPPPKPPCLRKRRVEIADSAVTPMSASLIHFTNLSPYGGDVPVEGGFPVVVGGG